MSASLFQIIMEKAVDTTIHLLMQGANHKDSGIYKCLPDNAPEAQIKVHILDGGMLVHSERFICITASRLS